MYIQYVYREKKYRLLYYSCHILTCVCLCLAAQEGVLSGRANGPGDLHGEADPLSGQ